MLERGSGILLHITSLPSPFGIGDMGKQAYEFADFLSKAEQKYWQVLPFNPTNPVTGNSPYSSVSAYATNILFISPQLLCDDGLISAEDIASILVENSSKVNFQKVAEDKLRLLNKAFEKFNDLNGKDEFIDFCKQNDYWLENFSSFLVFKKYFKDQLWSDWPKEIRDRDEKAMTDLKAEVKDCIEKEKFFQFLFFKQWMALKKYCNDIGIQIIGDIPIYVTYDSVDAWADPLIFKLDKNKVPFCVAGVPPDYFSETGQLWGNPVYNWDQLKKDDYKWWFNRIEHNLRLFDVIRIDHFRGFVDYWEVPKEEKTAINGSWQSAPAKDFFTQMLKQFPNIPLIAEDLGIITDELRDTIKHFKFPGMKIIMFAFGEDKPDHPYLPCNYSECSVAYTGTHDNNTLQGWFNNETNIEDKKRICDYLKKDVSADSVNLDLIELLMKSVAKIVLFPLQDVLGLDADDRMNSPGTVGDHNWSWRLNKKQLTSQIAENLAKMTLENTR